MKLTKFEDSLQERLRDPEYAQSYLQAALNDGGKAEWLVALREVALASDGGLKHVAEQAHVGRESMYKSLSGDGNPRWETVRSVLDTLGFELIVQKKGIDPIAEMSSQHAGSVKTAEYRVLPAGVSSPSAKPAEASSLSQRNSGVYRLAESRSGRTLSGKSLSSFAKGSASRGGKKSK
jgi:probable addiction module antidote protein